MGKWPKPQVFAASNGHQWAEWRFVSRTMVCCNLCGVIRRADDNNKPCRGKTRVGLRDPRPRQEGQP